MPSCTDRDYVKEILETLDMFWEIAWHDCTAVPFLSNVNMMLRQGG